jgi:hypothetical protein
MSIIIIIVIIIIIIIIIIIRILPLGIGVVLDGTVVVDIGQKEVPLEELLDSHRIAEIVGLRKIVTIQGTFREHSGNIQGTFREHSGTFRESSGTFWELACARWCCTSLEYAKSPRDSSIVRQMLADMLHCGKPETEVKQYQCRG